MSARQLDLGRNSTVNVASSLQCFTESFGMMLRLLAFFHGSRQRKYGDGWGLYTSGGKIRIDFAFCLAQEVRTMGYFLFVGLDKRRLGSQSRCQCRGSQVTRNIMNRAMS